MHCIFFGGEFSCHAIQTTYLTNFRGMFSSGARNTIPDFLGDFFQTECTSQWVKPTRWTILTQFPTHQQRLFGGLQLAVWKGLGQSFCAMPAFGTFVPAHGIAFRVVCPHTLFTGDACSLSSRILCCSFVAIVASVQTSVRLSFTNFTKRT